MKLFLRISIFNYLIWISTAGAFAQTGSIAGKVFSDGKPLQSANILLSGTKTGTITDSLGNFLLTRLQPGNYTLKASLIGYQELAKKNKFTAQPTTNDYTTGALEDISSNGRGGSYRHFKRSKAN